MNRLQNPSTPADQYTGPHRTAENEAELCRVFDPFDQPGCFLRVLKLAHAVSGKVVPAVAEAIFPCQATLPAKEFFRPRFH